jgi:D-arabinan exo alpha-(1,3)/(1,5)-arabinofuranosidase (non-reducing end)
MRLHGTGSEDYFNGGWYALLDRWDRGMSLPLHGALTYSLPLSRTGGYRFYLADKVSFEESLRQTIEHGPEGNRIPVDYTSVAFLYADRPPVAYQDPAESPPPPQPPGVHVFYPQLMEFSVAGGTSVTYRGGALEIRAEREGLVRFDVSELPPGRYRVKLSYRREPTGTEFSVWRRQTQISAWMDAGAEREERVDAVEMGEVVLTSQVKSVTIRTRVVDQRVLLRIDRLILESMP